MKGFPVPGFYYWFPIERNKLVNERTGRLNLDTLASFEAAYLFEGRDVVPDQTVWLATEGPGGNLGVLLYPKPVGEAELPKCFYDPDSQDWVRFKGYWIGRQNDSLPKPADLFRRRPLIGGYWVTDRNGNDWRIPCVRAKSESESSLPKVYGFDADGNYLAKIREQDQAIWELAGDAIDYLLRRKELKDEQVNRMAISFIGANYHLGVGEVYALATWGYEFLETEFVCKLLACVTDWQAVDEFTSEKKSTVPT